MVVHVKFEEHCNSPERMVLKSSVVTMAKEWILPDCKKRRRESARGVFELDGEIVAVDEISVTNLMSSNLTLALARTLIRRFDYVICRLQNAVAGRGSTEVLWLIRQDGIEYNISGIICAQMKYS